jgi:hypothetical protein
MATKRRSDGGSETEASTSKQSTQNLVDDLLSQGPKPKPAPVTQEKFNQSLLNMLVEDMQPLATVERTGFKKFCSIVTPEMNIPSRRSLGRYTDEAYSQAKAKLVETLDKVEFVSVSADLWSSHKRSFIGMTVHFIDEQTLQRNSNVLTCQRMKHAHTGEVIARKMIDVFDEFHINSKVVTCVTDNAANMIKMSLFLKENTAQADVTTDHDDDVDESDESELEAISVVDLIQGDEATVDLDIVTMLKKHVRCANHTLNLVASVDALNA